MNNTIVKPPQAGARVYRVSAPFPPSYLESCKRTKRKPITADYALWRVRCGQRPMVPATFTTKHLDALPIAERKRWLMVARRRYLAAQRRKAA